MSTIAELKEWLNRFPDDTIVEVGFQQAGRNYESYGQVNFEELKIEDSDSGNGWEHYNNRDGINRLLLGESM